ncbi:hypothetical protein [Xanthomonas sp. XNM01]|uniref:hypothetical protein n=1 Tax=Xanthomonas sp. XNM01 TaxID=2769289 RepID=UPI0017826E09|nr:hypothetical protein [Xanthomonas sp. XNM01]MBD9368815.1 hypothetical protein [Xanthomonas sp. XNM01]
MSARAALLTAALGAGARKPASSTMAELAPPQHASAYSNRRKHCMAGYGDVRTIMAFMRWAVEQDRFPSVEAVQTRFAVCRATAYRWTLALAETYGIDPAIRNHAEKRGRIRAS